MSSWLPPGVTVDCTVDDDGEVFRLRTHYAGRELGELAFSALVSAASIRHFDGAWLLTCAMAWQRMREIEDASEASAALAAAVERRVR